MKHNDIAELTRECQEAERLYTEAMKARSLAVAASQEALRVATKTRARLIRALASQAIAREAVGDGVVHE